jgi:hypothetical protein
VGRTQPRRGARRAGCLRRCLIRRGEYRSGFYLGAAPGGQASRPRSNFSRQPDLAVVTILWELNTRSAWGFQIAAIPDCTDTALFCTDTWEDSFLHLKFPHLVTFAKRTYQSVWEVISLEFLQDLFHLPLSKQDFQEFEKLEQICDNAFIQVQNGLQDKWVYI